VLTSSSTPEEDAMVGWKLFYTSRILEREVEATFETLDRALKAAWAVSWRDGDVLRIDGPHGEKLDAVTIANHLKRPK
jgi:hypothetical protein